jgi:hypothetical protein
MNETNEKNISDEIPVTLDEEVKAPIQKKKRNTKLHIFLVLVLGACTWAFWTFAPLAQQLKVQWLSGLNQEHSIEHETSSPASLAAESVLVSDEQPQVTNEPAQTPSTQPIEEELTFEPAPDLNLAIIQTTTADAVATIQVESLNDITAAMQQLQSQVNVMQQTINNMHTQQLQQATQQVQAQLFSILRKATAPQASLDDMAIAWKSISFMPLLSEDKRVFADGAFVALQDLQSDMQNASHEVSNLINSLAQQLQPRDLKEVAEAITTDLNPIQDTDVFYSWLDWIKQQFMLSKVDQHAVTISDDPYADIKSLMGSLDQLKQAINNAQWDDITNLNTLFYQLEQRGMETNITHEMIKQFKLTQQNWQQQAQVWLEQL